MAFFLTQIAVPGGSAATMITMRDLDYVVASHAIGVLLAHFLSYVLLPGIVNSVIVLATL